jgi:hypothetical protein
MIIIESNNPIQANESNATLEQATNRTCLYSYKHSCQMIIGSVRSVDIAAWSTSALLPAPLVSRARGA